MTIGTVASHYEIGLGNVSKQLLSLPSAPSPLPQNFSKSELVGVSKLFQRNLFHTENDWELWYLCKHNNIVAQRLANLWYVKCHNIKTINAMDKHKFSWTYQLFGNVSTSVSFIYN